MQLAIALATLGLLNSVVLAHSHEWADSSMVARVEQYVRRILGPNYMIRRAGNYGGIERNEPYHNDNYSSQYHHGHRGLRHKVHKEARKIRRDLRDAGLGHRHHHHRVGPLHTNYHHDRHVHYGRHARSGRYPVYHHRHHHSHGLGHKVHKVEHKIHKIGRKIKRGVKQTLRAVGLGHHRHHVRGYGKGYRYRDGKNGEYYPISHRRVNRHHYRHNAVGRAMHKVSKDVRKILRGGHPHHYKGRRYHGHHHGHHHGHYHGHHHRHYHGHHHGHYHGHRYGHRHGHGKGYGDFVRVYRFPLNSHVSGEIVIE